LIKDKLCILYTKRAFKALSVSRLLGKKITAYKTNSYPVESCVSSINNITNTLGKNEIKLKEEEHDRYSCWCFLLIDGTQVEAKIIHKGRGKFKILNDEHGGKYTNKIVDASDVVRCRTEI
jgi:hypothetical protein